MQNCKKIHWQRQNKAAIPASLAPWMTHPGSFITKLNDHGINAKIIVVNQQWAYPTTEERHALTLHPRSYCLIREVLIHSEGKHWMFARTVLPQHTLTGKHKQLARLKSRSLGSVLFKDPDMRRGSFEFASLSAGDTDFDILHDTLTLQTTTLWARRSIFTLKEKPLLLTEIFLPDIETL